jgi:hypothetical protein
MFWARYVLDAGEILDVGVVVVVANLRKAPSPTGNRTGSPRSIIPPGEPELELSIAIMRA